MRRLAVTLVIALGLGFVSATPAQADPAFRDYSHHSCPNGIQLNLGGGEGWRHWMRVAAWEWNTFVAPKYSFAPRITSITYWGGWNGHVSYRPCLIDMDEIWDGGGSAWAQLYSRYGHISGAGIWMQSATWWETERRHDRDFIRHYIAVHELHHAFGLGHNPLCDSVMSYCWRTLAHNWRDRDTLIRMYSHSPHRY